MDLSTAPACVDPVLTSCGQRLIDIPNMLLPGCLICGAAEVNVPYAAQPCGHTFCYYCLRAHTLADPGYKCLACFVPVTAMRRWRPPPA